MSENSSCLVKVAKVNAVEGMEYFLRNFSHIPDDKLNWTATGTSKSAIRIAAHTSLYAARFAKMIRTRELPNPENLEQWLADRTREEVELTDRSEMESIFRTGTAEVIEVLDSVSEEDLGLTLHSGVDFKMPMTRMINLPGWHATLHAGQIDMLQTCWDDQQVYF